MNDNVLLPDETIIKETNFGLFLTNKRVVFNSDNLYESIRLDKISALKCESSWSFNRKAFVIVLLILVAAYVYLSYSDSNISVFPGIIVLVVANFLCLKGNHFIAIYSCGTMCIQENISKKNKKDFIEFLKSVDEKIDEYNKNKVNNPIN